MFSSLDRVIQEINLRFQQLHKLAEKYVFLTPTYLIDDQYECQLTYAFPENCTIAQGLLQ